MTRKTNKTSKAKNTKKAKKAAGRSQAVDELDQLEMFQEDEFDAEGPYEDDFEDDGSDVDFAAVEEALQEAGDVLDADIHHEPHAHSKRIQKRRHRQPAERSSGLNILLIVGWLLLIPSGGLLLASVAAPAKMGLFLESLRTAGLTPTALITISVVVIGIAILRARQANIELRVGEVETTLLDNDTGMSASLDYLVEAQEQHMDRPPASGEELERVLVVLERQDEKVNNLTKAIKMYGKPLIEITKQMAEVSTRVEAFRSSLGNVTESMDISGLEASVASLSGDLQKQVAGELQKILAEVQKQDDGTLSKGLDELKAELSQVAAGIQKLQQTAAAAARAVPPARSGPATSAAPAAPSTIGSSSQDTGKPGLAQSISGTKSTSGKDVLGSIAKLKKMRQ